MQVEPVDPGDPVVFAPAIRRAVGAADEQSVEFESRRDGDQVRQQVIATLGRYEELQESGQLERLLRSGARFTSKELVLSASSRRLSLSIAQAA